MSVAAPTWAGENEWTLIQPVGGVATQFVESDGRIFFASNTRVFRSTDDGATWSGIAAFDDTVRDLAVDGDLVFVAADDSGLYRSTDGGDTWEQVDYLAATNMKPWAVVVATDGLVYAADFFEGIHVSADGGNTWGPIGDQPEGRIRTLVVNPADPDMIFAGFEEGGVARSLDGGASWTEINNGLSADRSIQVLEMSADGAILMAGDAYDSNHFYRSVDSGTNWQLMVPDAFNRQATSVAFDPNDSNVVYAGFTAFAVSPNSRVLKSSNGGLTWGYTANQDADYPPEVTGVHLRTDGSLVIGTGRGLFVSANDGATWTEANSGFANTVINNFAVSSPQAGHLYATSSFSSLGGQTGIFRSTDGGVSWKPRIGDIGLQVYGFRVVAAHPEIGNRIVVGRNIKSTIPPVAARLYVSSDAGNSWTPDANDVDMSSPSVFAFDPQNPDTIYLLSTGEDAVFRSVDGGLSWHVRSDNLPDPNFGNGREALVVSPTNPDVLYAGTLRGVYRSEDGGATWEPRRGALGEIWVSSLAVHPDDPDTVYVGFRTLDGLYRSTDGGGSWVQIYSGHRIGGFALDPADPDRILALGYNIGAEPVVIASVDGGLNWIEQNEGLVGGSPQASVGVAFDPNLTARYYLNLGGVLQSFDGGLAVNLESTLNLSSTSIQTGDDVTITFSVTNLIGYSATGVTLTLNYPAFTSVQSLTLDGGTCVYATTEATCSIDTLAVESVQEGSLILRGDSTGNGIVVIGATSDETDFDTTNNIRQASVSVTTPTPPSSGGGGGGGGGGHGAGLLLLAPLLLPALRRQLSL